MRAGEWIAACVAALGVGGCYVGLDTSGGCIGPACADDGGADTAATSGPSGGDDTDAEPDEPPGEACEDQFDVATPLRRLSHAAYINTLVSLFGPELLEASLPLGLLPTDGERHAYLTEAKGLSMDHVVAYNAIAKSVALWVVGDDERLAALSPCTEPECVDDLIDDFGERAFRRPLAAEEAQSLRATYDAGAAENHRSGLRALLQVMLQDPRLLYLVETRGEPRSDDANVVDLSGRELAARLSYAIWQAPPDEELLAAADAGELFDAAGRRAEARRLLDDPRGREGLRGFHERWLGIDELPVLAHSDAFLDGQSIEGLAAAATEEVLALTEDVVASDGTYADLLTSRKAFVANTDLAAIYGIEPAQETQLPSHRAGVLTRVGTLLAGSDWTRPIIRGVLVRERFLCDAPPPPPASVDVDDQPPVEREGQTTREFTDALTGAAECASCHVLINPFGYALGKFDALGRYGDEEVIIGDNLEVSDVLPVDASVTVTIDGDALQLDGGAALSEAIAASEQGRTCYTNHLVRFTRGREPSEDEACHIAALAADHADAPIADLVARIVADELNAIRVLEDSP